MLKHDELSIKVDGKVVFLMTREEGFFSGKEISFIVKKKELQDMTK